MAGLPTTAGSRAVAETARPAEQDAPCLDGARRAAGVGIVGKVNLHELAFGASGVNGYFGTPVNPIDPARVPGAPPADPRWRSPTTRPTSPTARTLAVVRIPAAFCGITGLKTTHGRISLDGVWPLAPSLDTVGPMARDVAGVAAAWRCSSPASRWIPPRGGPRLARVRPAGPDVVPTSTRPLTRRWSAAASMSSRRPCRAGSRRAGGLPAPSSTPKRRTSNRAPLIAAPGAA